MKKMFCLLSLLILGGCATAASIQKAYTLVNREDGIDAQEAVVIAKKHLLETEFKKDYSVGTARVVENLIVRDYPEYWFVSFNRKYYDLSFWEYLVVVNKKTGDVYFANPYVPLNVADYDWIFHPQTYPRKVGDVI